MDLFAAAGVDLQGGSGHSGWSVPPRIRRVPLKVGQVQECLKRQGIGSAALLRGQLGWDG